MSLVRRTFLKLGMIATGTVLLSKYTETNDLVALEGKSWVEDKGGFYIIRIPDFKTFANEVLDKPTIILMGEQSNIRGCIFNGYVKLQPKNNSSIVNTKFDASNYTGIDKPPLFLANAKNFVIRDCHVVGQQCADSVVFAADTKDYVVSNCLMVSQQNSSRRL